MIVSPTLKARLDAKTVVVAGGCLCWSGATNEKGYGRIYGGQDSRGARVLVSTHRAAYYLKYGVWPDVVMHVCDTPSCVNVEHLVAGTQLDNMRDMREKGRGYDPSTLDYFAQREIQTLIAQGHTLLGLSARLGLSYGVVRRAAMAGGVKARAGAPRGYRHVTEAQVDLARAQRAAGAKLKDIAKTLGVSTTLAWKITRDPPQPENP
jgi:hypothetical protein